MSLRRLQLDDNPESCYLTAPHNFHKKSWCVVHTLPRQEKSLAIYLQSLSSPRHAHFLPLVLSPNSSKPTLLPFLPGILFLAHSDKPIPAETFQSHDPTLKHSEAKLYSHRSRFRTARETCLKSGHVMTAAGRNALLYTLNQKQLARELQLLADPSARPAPPRPRDLLPGEEVIVISGPLKDTRAVVDHTTPNENRIYVALQILGQTVSVQISPRDLSHAEPDHSRAQ